MSALEPALDPELAAALAVLPKAANGTLLDLSDIPALRSMLEAAAGQMPPSPLDPRVSVEDLRLPRPDGSELSVLLYRPIDADGDLPALLWFHAGAQVLGGDGHEDDAYHSALALDLDCVVAAVVYRLAPETQAPGAAEDGYLAYAHLVSHAVDHRLDPERIGIAAASGGGGPAAASALMIRDHHDQQPRVLALLYPMLDDRGDTPSSHEKTAGVIIGRDDLQHAWAAVLGDRIGTPDVDAYSAPARATDLAGLPDTFVAVAQYDVLRDEGIDFALRALGAGVPVDLHVYARAFHAWDRFAPDSTLTRALEHTWHDFARRHLHG